MRLLWAPGHVLGNVDDGVEDLRGVGCVGRLKRALPGRTGRHLQVSVIINATVCLSVCLLFPAELAGTCRYLSL